MSQADYYRFLKTYDDSDRLVFFLRNRHRAVTGHEGKERAWTLQRVAAVREARSDTFHAALLRQNQMGTDIYVGMNPVLNGVNDRTKAHIACIRHLYLDFDDHGDTSVDALLADVQVPVPHMILHTSQGKWQVIWRVADFSPDLAEDMHRRLVSHFRADPAAIDVSRVLRLPSFYNHKYNPPFPVTLIRHATPLLRPADFQAVPSPRDCPPSFPRMHRPCPRTAAFGCSQSERDWAWTLERLKQGDSPNSVIEQLAARRHDKPSPLYYARHTVTRAEQELHLRAQSGKH